MRIAHFLATAGIDSRRKCEQLVLKGYVQINGKRLTDLGRQVDRENDIVTYRGNNVRLPEPVFIMMNKPRGYTVTAGDPHAKKTVYELLPKKFVPQTHEAMTHKIRIFAVGRLEKEISGLLLFTNDGDLSNHLTHPKYGVSRFYEVRLHKPWEPKDAQHVLKGIKTSDGRLKVMSFKPVSPRVLVLELQQGKTGHIERLFRKLNYNVQSVHRVGFGPLTMGTMPVGASRFLTKFEAKALRDASANISPHTRLKKARTRDGDLPSDADIVSESGDALPES